MSAAPPAASSYTVGDEVVPGPDESGRAGPMSKDALRQLHTKGTITSATWVWAAGMQTPQQLSHVRELRWMLSSGLGLLGPFDAALVALQVRVCVCVCVWCVIGAVKHGFGFCDLHHHHIIDTQCNQNSKHMDCAVSVSTHLHTHAGTLPDL